MKKGSSIKKKGKRISQEKLHGITIRLVSNALWMLVIAVLLCIGIVGMKYTYNFGYRVFLKETKNVESEELTVTIGEGISTIDVGTELKNSGLIDDAYVFLAQSIIFDLKVKPGTYTINRNNTTREILEIFNNGPLE